MKCVDMLIEEHKTILLALNILDAMALRVERGENLPADDVEALLDFLKTFADDHHQGKEETALFPELMRAGAAQTDPVRHMVFEHDQERSLVKGLEDALRTKSGREFVYCANRLSGLLRNHIYKEDHILFETVELALSPEQDKRISEEFSEIDRQARLEWQYLAKTGNAQAGGGGREEAASTESK
jgi:hemerythrin-like domain-containing protein